MIIKVKPDMKKVKSMFRLAESREESVLVLNIEKFSTVVAEMYYEILKEFSSILDGFKSVGEHAHKDLIDFLSNYESILEKEIVLIHGLRVKRNSSMYEGKEIDKDYLKDNELKYVQIIKKLKFLIKNKL